MLFQTQFPIHTIGMGEPNLFSNPNAYEEWVMRQREANNAAARNRNREYNIAWAEHTRRFAEQPVRKNEVNQTHRREYEERFTGLAPEEPSAKEIEHMRFIRSLEERQVQVKPQLQHEEFIPNTKPKNKPSRFQRFTQKLKNIKNSVSRRFGFSKKRSPERMRLINSTSKALRESRSQLNSLRRLKEEYILGGESRNEIQRINEEIALAKNSLAMAEKDDFKARNAGKVPISLRNKIGKGLSKLGSFIGWGSRKNKNYKP